MVKSAGYDKIVYQIGRYDKVNAEENTSPSTASISDSPIILTSTMTKLI